ncbi:hypothetical protein ACLOJK_031631 [Asimina triloba]
MASVVAQAAGVDAVRIISLIVKSAHNAKMHRTNCVQIATHLKMIGNLLEKLKSTDLINSPTTREPLDGLEDALRRTLELVESCRHRSYLYLLAMGWSIVYQFRQAQAEIDRFMKILPLISLVDGYRIQERLQAIEQDHREYTLDEEEAEIQHVLLKSTYTKEDADILEKSLSRRYPHLGFDDALREENQKLHIELQKSQKNNDAANCNVIQHLIEVTETVADKIPEKNHSYHAPLSSRSGPTNFMCLIKEPRTNNVVDDGVDHMPCSVSTSFVYTVDGLVKMNPVTFLASIVLIHLNQIDVDKWLLIPILGCQGDIVLETLGCLRLGTGQARSMDKG